MPGQCPARSAPKTPACPRLAAFFRGTQRSPACSNGGSPRLTWPGRPRRGRMSPRSTPVASPGTCRSPRLLEQWVAVGLPWADRAFAGLLRRTPRSTATSPRLGASGLQLIAGRERNRIAAGDGSTRCPDVGRRAPARQRWCDQIPTPAENQLYPYSEHSCAHRRSHNSGKLFGD